MASPLQPTNGGLQRSPLLSPDNPRHLDYVKLMEEFERHYKEASIDVWSTANDYWDLFLGIQEDTRDPVDESWRSDVFVPLPYITTRTKAAQGTELIGNTEPIWQVEATRETSNWYEQSRHYERLLDYAGRMNRFRKLIYKLYTSRSVQGTTFLKVVWTKRRHVITLFPNPEDEAEFLSGIQKAVQLGAPQPPSRLLQPEEFDQWRRDINMAGRFGMIPAAPVSGPKEIVEYEGPLLQQIPLWAMRLDPMIDEIENQSVIIHRMVKPLSYVLQRADMDPNSPLPYFRDMIDFAMDGWDGKVLEEEQEALASSLGLNPQAQNHPYFQKSVELWEIWSPEEPFKYSIVMNRKGVINKRATEWPLLTTHPNIFALRNVIVPGHFFGLSDYQEPFKLFKELNQFRRIRMDGATLTTLPVFVKAAGIHLGETMRKVRPGMVLTLPTKDGIQSLIKHTLPAEAYREPQEIKLEIEDATEVYSSVKGAPATVNRVTGTEYQGRASQVLLKYKVDASLVEEELSSLPNVMLSLFAQMGPGRLRKEIGGDPDAVVDVTRDKLVEAINMRFRFRGATRHIEPDLMVQQLQMAMNNMRDVMTPAERRLGLQLIMELMDIRGWSKVVTEAGTMQLTAMADTAANAQIAGNSLATDQTRGAAIVPPGGAAPPTSGAPSNATPAQTEGASS